MFEVVDRHKKTVIAFEAVMVAKACQCFEFHLQLRQHHCFPRRLRRFIEGSSACVAVSFEQSALVVLRVEGPGTASGGTAESFDEKRPFAGGFPQAIAMTTNPSYSSCCASVWAPGTDAGEIERATD